MTLQDIIELVKQLKKERNTENIGIFVNGGWGSQDTEYFIIVNGDGQDESNPITKELYAECLRDRWVMYNSLTTYKARKYHAFNFNKIMGQ